MGRLRTALVAASLVALVLAAPAHAAFPGKNGKIAYSDCPVGIDTVEHCDIWTVNPDGTGPTPLTNTGAAGSPAWSPDGNFIAFTSPTPSSQGGGTDIYVMRSNGTEVRQLTHFHSDCPSGPAWSPDGQKIVLVDNCGPISSAPRIDVVNIDGTGLTTIATNAFGPAWSPGGQKIAFNRNGAIWTMNPDGSGEAQLTNPSGFASDASPNWSPDGAKLIFSSDRHCSLSCAQSDLYTVNADGSNVTRLRNGLTAALNPAWSPDGTKVVFLSCFDFCTRGTCTADSCDADIHVINADGTGERVLAGAPEAERDPDWQPLPINYYPRPKGATPLRASLTIAYQPCSSPNRDHGSPLVAGSCNPPQMTSQYLTVGTGDANGMLPRSEGAVRFDSVLDKPATPADESDVKLQFTMSDVFTKALADYAGELRPEVEIQATDKDNTPSPGGTGAATTALFELGFSAPCTPTDDTTIGSDCGTTTSANALLPGMVAGGYRAIWQFGQVRVYDGGSDGVGSTTADNTLFADEGIFTP